MILVLFKFEFLSLINVGLIINPPFKIDAYAVAACKGVVVIPCP